MSLESMTGFGRAESFDESFRVVVEIKSVNHRYKDFRFRIPSLFSSLEIYFKKKIAEVFQRGSFDISINYKRSDTQNKFADVDEVKVNSFLNKIKSMKSLENIKLEVNPVDFLRNEFYLDMADNEDSMALLAQDAFEKAMMNLKESRLEEGAKLEKVLVSHSKTYQSYFSEIENKAPGFQKTIEEKIRTRLAEYKDELKIEENRLLQEIVFYLEKMDIHEEINRVNSHLEKLDKLIKSDKEVGRQLDFLVQELNRETNTIGSKSSMIEISDNVVKMKVELEKIREQGLNLQ